METDKAYWYTSQLRTICLSKLSNEVGFVWSWDGSVRKVTGYGLDYRLRFSSGRGFFSLLPYSGPTTLLPTIFRANHPPSYHIQGQPPSFLPTAYRGNFQHTSRDRSVSQTIHFYLDPRLRIRGALSPFPVWLSMG